jgi:diguanylate cyclase (GGDEF)-like protein
MAEREISVDVVETFLKARHKSLAFPPALERRLDLDTRARRAKQLKANTIGNIFIYNLFLGFDLVLTPDQIGLSAALHFGIVSPLMVAFILWVNPQRPRRWREGAVAALAILVALQILVVFCASNSPHAEHYQYLVLLAILHNSAILRLPFVYAGTVVAFIVGWHAVAVIASGHMALPVALMASAMVVCCAYVTVVATFHGERDARRAYLHSLLDHLRLQQSKEDSQHDALTGLANRRLLEERLEELWRAGDDLSSPVAAILIDVDHFKAYNDCYGHVNGDVCLKRIAACIMAELRNERDLATRFGGEEILLLLPSTEFTDAVRVAERIRRAIEALALPHKGAATRQIVTVSLGVSAVPVSSLSAAELIAAADMALYAAKHKGRNQVWPAALRQLGSDDIETPALLRIINN